jgi:hypothetical protein
MLDVALEVPLTLFPLGGFAERDHPSTARIKVFGEPLDGAALAGRVPTLEHDHHPLACYGYPVLEFQQLDLQQALRPVVLRPAHPRPVRIVVPPRVHFGAIRPPQDRLVLVAVVSADALAQLRERLRDLGRVIDHRCCAPQFS